MYNNNNNRAAPLNPCNKYCNSDKFCHPSISPMKKKPLKLSHLEKKSVKV